MSKEPVLKAQHLGITFGGLKAVDDFCLEIGESELVGLIGPNGAGKTTVFNRSLSAYGRLLLPVRSENERKKDPSGCCRRDRSNLPEYQII